MRIIKLLRYRLLGSGTSGFFLNLSIHPMCPIKHQMHPLFTLPGAVLRGFLTKKQNDCWFCTVLFYIYSVKNLCDEGGWFSSFSVLFVISPKKLQSASPSWPTFLWLILMEATGSSLLIRNCPMQNSGGFPGNEGGSRNLSLAFSAITHHDAYYICALTSALEGRVSHLFVFI